MVRLCSSFIPFIFHKIEIFIKHKLKLECEGQEDHLYCTKQNKTKSTQVSLETKRENS